MDGGGNRLQRMTVGGTPYDYTYDANGNLTRETTSRLFTWTHADRLATFATQTPGAEPSVHAHYLYDAGGERVVKLVRRQGGLVEVTCYLGGFEHHRWTGGANNHTHVMDHQSRIALARTGPTHPDDRGPAVQFHLGDHLGSSTVIIDDTGAPTNREEYTPYGETSFGSFVRKRYRFTGQERDEESGLAYHGARYLMVWLARWASCDPAGPAQLTNLYRYGADSPLRFVDPLGTDDKESPRAANAKPATDNPELLQRKADNGLRHEAAAARAAGKLKSVPWGEDPYERHVGAWLISGGMGANATRRYIGLDPQRQTWVRGAMERGWGCTGCHVTTQVRNTHGPGAINPANGLPYDEYINQDRFYRYAQRMSFARAHITSGVLTGSMAAISSSAFAPSAADASIPLRKGMTFDEVAATIEARAKTFGFDHVTAGQGLSAVERTLVADVTNAPTVIAGRSVNVEAQGMFMLDDYLAVRNIAWTPRIQEVYNHALFVRTSMGGSVSVMAGGGYTATEVMAAEAGATMAGSKITNAPYWPAQ